MDSSCPLDSRAVYICFGEMFPRCGNLDLLHRSRDVKRRKKMKKRVFKMGIISMILIIGFSLVGCASGPSSVPVDMAGTTWVWSSGNDSSTYTFIDSTTYKVSYTGAFEAQSALAGVIARTKGVASDEIGTGTYSVSKQTVALKPAGGVYLQVASNGRINMVTDVDTFTVEIANDSFVLGAITYKKVQ